MTRTLSQPAKLLQTNNNNNNNNNNARVRAKLIGKSLNDKTKN
jgi:hypothetical protein